MVHETRENLRTKDKYDNTILSNHFRPKKITECFHLVGSWDELLIEHGIKAKSRDVKGFFQFSDTALIIPQQPNSRFVFFLSLSSKLVEFMASKNMS